MHDVKQCEFCGLYFEAKNGTQKFCSERCVKENQRLRNKQRTQTECYHAKVNERYFENTERLNKYIFEATELGLSYGKYRMLRDVFHKSFEEIKNEYKNMSYLR